MTNNSAYVLVFHGSRDVRAQRGSQQLTKLIQTSLNNFHLPWSRQGGTLLLSKPARVEAAYLELAQVSLAERIYQIGLTAEQLKIIPMLLTTGVHVQIDIPTAVAQAQAQLGNRSHLQLCAHLGAARGIVELVRRQYPQLAEAGRILLAHGSRLAVANQEIERLARQVDALAAYSFIPPNLETQIQQLIKQGKKNITIVPYVLFAGKISEAIALEVQNLQAQLPQIRFLVTQPLGNNQDLAQLVTSIIQQL